MLQAEHSKTYHIESEKESSRLERQASHPNYSLAREIPNPELPDGAKVLDAGCGSGLLLRFLAEKNSSRKISLHGVDGSPVRIEQAKELSRSLSSVSLPTLSFECAQLHKLPYPDSSFDRIYLRFVLQHIADPVPILREMRRILKPKGAIYVIDADGVFFNLETQNVELATSLRKLEEVNRKNRLFSSHVCREMPRFIREAGLSTSDLRSEVMCFITPEDRAFEAAQWQDRLTQAMPLFKQLMGEEQAFRFKNQYVREIENPDFLFYYTKFIFKLLKA